MEICEISFDTHVYCVNLARKEKLRKRPSRNNTDNLTSLHCPSKTALIQLLNAT
jgi:hypothetical protein